MNQVAVFQKVSFDQFYTKMQELFPLMEDSCIHDAYNNLKLPVRGTAGSAGYDFVTPVDVILAPGETVLIPTGVRALIDDGWVLTLCPRSGLGFKYKMQLDNTLGIIDSDYYFADNEGHIMVKITNDSRDGKTLKLTAGDRFIQGIFLPFGITYNDEAAGKRTGGFGSTGS